MPINRTQTGLMASYLKLMDSRRKFIKQVGVGTAGLIAAPSLLSAMPFDIDGPENLPRSTPEMQGVSSDALKKMYEAMDASDIEFHSVMVMRNGYVISEGWWEPYGAQYKHSLYSLSKSFTSAAVGLAINEGHFTVEDKVISFFPELLPSVISPNLAAMTVKHLLTMNTGHTTEPGLRGANWAQNFLAATVENAPGTFYLYNTSATYMLSAIVQKKTGKTLLEYLTPRLFEPLKIVGADWEQSPQGINSGGVGLRIRTEDIASFSQLYLNKGKWNGKQIIPASWIEDSSISHWDFKTNPFGGKSPKDVDDWQQGYGYQFWRTRHNGYRSDGLYGQFGIILPDENLVVAITEESFSTQKTLNFIWDILLPGVQKGKLPVNTNAQQALKAETKSLKVKFKDAAKTSPIANTISSKIFVLEDNKLNAKSVTFNITNNNCELIVHSDNGDRKLNYGINNWDKSKNGKMQYAQLPFPVPGLPNVTSVDVAGNATWLDDTTLYLATRAVETVNSDAITCKFDGNRVTLDFLDSVSKARKQKDRRGTVTGRIV